MSKVVPAFELENRRLKLFQKLPSYSLFLVASNKVQIRNGDVEFPFYQNSDFWYFTGFNESDAVFLLIKGGQEDMETILFCKPKDPLKEIWNGPVSGPELAKELTFVDKVLEIDKLAKFLDQICGGLNNLFFVPNQQIEYIEKKYEFSLKTLFEGKIKTAEEELTALRLIKSDWEVEQIKKATQIAASAHNLILHNLPYYPPLSEEDPNVYEYLIEAEFLRFFKSQNLDWSYLPIIASGQNGTILHYQKNQAALEPGKLLLMDVGCDYNYYSSDITRTYPISCQFNSIQKEVYELVLKANLETIKFSQTAIDQDLNLLDLHNFSCQILASGLKEFGLLEGSLDEILEKKSYKKFFPHSIGHFMGLDVHDCVYSKNLKNLKLEPGMVFTVEPGLYFSANDETLPEDLRGLAIRIEDDILLTESGFVNFTESAIKDPIEIEKNFNFNNQEDKKTKPDLNFPEATFSEPF